MGVPGYEELEGALYAAGAGVMAAECHGFLYGQLCSADFPAQELWPEFLNLRTTEDRLAEDCREYVRLLLEETSRRLWTGDFDFQLLLPGDDTGLQERVEALALWCQGFLSGLGLVAEFPAPALSDDVQEWLMDVEMIARAGVDEPDAGDELALVQVADHVRTGVLLIIEELRMHRRHADTEALH